VRLNADLRIANAAATFNALRDAARGRSQKVILDARAVAKADSAGLQALLAGRRALLDSGKSVAWSACPVTLRSAASLLGLADALELPE
jgi:anti-anti-sigma regulatory factor